MSESLSYERVVKSQKRRETQHWSRAHVTNERPSHNREDKEQKTRERLEKQSCHDRIDDISQAKGPHDWLYININPKYIIVKLTLELNLVLERVSTIDY